MRSFTAFFALALVSASSAVPMRNQKEFSIFSVVNFPNDECTATSSTTSDVTKGTCLSSTECSDKDGSSDGNCASGFGTCCTFVIDATTGGTAKENITYIQNNNYPTAITTASSTISYTVDYTNDNICQLRFDFDNLVLPVTTATGVCLGSFTIDGPSLKDPPSICGTLTGEHIYAEVGRSSTTTKVTVATGTGTTNRTWKIRISQIECSNPSKPPADCTQYYTGTSGSFKSLAFTSTTLLASQEITHCFRQEMGFCSINYFEETASSTPDSFLMTTGTIPANTAGSETSDCDASRLMIPHDNPTTSFGVYCGTFLNSVGDMTASGTVTQRKGPFRIFFNSLADTSSSTGYFLNYSQSSCI